jgi:hypothetical protein
MKHIFKKIINTALVLSLLFSGWPLGIPFALAANSKIRQEINITDAYLGSTSGAYATSSARVQIDTTKYNGATYYFEVVASTTSAVSSNIYLKDATTFATIATINFSNSNTYTIYRSASFTPTSGANDYVVVIGNEAVQKGAIATRVIVLQDAASITSTETQIEIGNNETYTSSATSTLASPKYWFYDSTKWDASPSFYVGVTYARTVDPTSSSASSTDYLTAGTYTYQVSSGATQVVVEAWGGGGAGGGGVANTNSTSGGGGAGGQYVKSTIASPSGSHTLVVAATKAGVAATTGGSGNDSTYDTTTVVAKGGAGGTNSAGGSGGGAGSLTGAVGDVKQKGGNGSAGVSGTTGAGGGGAGSGGDGGNASSATAGSGTATGGGNGGTGILGTGNTAGNQGTQAGGGGGGAIRNGLPGSGAAGRITLTETISQSANATTTIALQEDDGSFANWGTAGGNQEITIVAAGTASTPTRVRVPFTPTSGRNYRLVMKNGYNGATFAVYNAKIVVDQSGGGGTGTGDITSNLEGWWKFDEGTGTNAADSTVNGHTGTLNGDATWHSPGKIGASSASYSGTTGGGTSISPITTGTTFTYSAWIYLSSGAAAGYHNLFTAGSGSGLWLRSTDKIDFYFGGDHESNTALSRDTWHHIAVVNNAGSVTFYLDGNSDGTAASGPSFNADGMGCDGGTGGECFVGYQDDVRLYTRALSSTDITDLYAYGTSATSITKLEPQYLLGNKLFSSGTGLQKFLTSWASTEWVTSSNSYFHEIDSAAGSSVAEIDTEAGSTVSGTSVTADAVRKRSSSFTMPADGNLDVKATTNNGDVYASRIIVQVTLSTAAAAASSAMNGLVHVAGKIFRIVGRTLRIK